MRTGYQHTPKLYMVQLCPFTLRGYVTFQLLPTLPRHPTEHWEENQTRQDKENRNGSGDDQKKGVNTIDMKCSQQTKCENFKPFQKQKQYPTPLIQSSRPDCFWKICEAHFLQNRKSLRNEVWHNWQNYNRNQSLSLIHI